MGEGDGHSQEKERETIVRSGIVGRRKGTQSGEGDTVWIRKGHSKERQRDTVGRRKRT